MTEDYIEYPYMKDNVLEHREYQVQLAETAVNVSTLIVLPTGTGKTPIAMMATAQRLSGTSEVSNRRSLMLAPTKPLVDQHADEFRRVLDIPDHEVKVFTGETRPDKREELWNEPASVVISTPQVVENDLIAGRISLENVVHLIFDECHRASGDYPYEYIAERYWEQAEAPLVTGLSASPGSDKEEILQVCKNLQVRNIEVLTEDDESLSKYTSETEVTPKTIDLTDELEQISELLQEPYTDVLKELKDIGVIDTRDKRRVSERNLQSARGRANELIQNDDSSGYRAQSLISEARKFLTAINAVETKGVAEVRRKFDKWEQEAEAGKSKAVKRFLERENVKEARRILRDCDDPHPKLKELRSRVVGVDLDGGQTLVFTESRRMANRIVEFISGPKITAEKFVGQSDTDVDEGLSQSEQQEVISRFREGEIDVLVATSVAEEGLDIPSVDLVIFYEPIASAIRSVQRRGRTGRQRAGKVVILKTRDSRDEGAYYAAKNREENMKSALEELKKAEDEIQSQIEEEIGQSELDAFTGSEDEGQAPSVEQVESSATSGEERRSSSETEVEFSDEESDDIVIYADTRELKSSVTKELSKRENVDLRTEQLEVGDYIVSDRCAVERKTDEDLKSTITGDERDLFEQLGDLRNAYNKPVLLLEGDLDSFFSHGIHPNAVIGILSAVILGMDTYPLPSRNDEETANYIYSLARREQEERDREVSLHGSKSSKSLAEQQEYVVSSIIGVGPVTTRNLLEEFGSVRNVLSASEERLVAVDNVGEDTARQITKVAESEYEPDPE